MPAAPFIPYVTISGDRWDSIAWKYYGASFIPALSALLAANPRVPISAVIPQGTAIAVPILGDLSVPPTDLPPWGTL